MVAISISEIKENKRYYESVPFFAASLKSQKDELEIKAENQEHILQKNKFVVDFLYNIRQLI